MNLAVLTATETIVNASQVDKISGEAGNGSFTLLPRHIDFVTALDPGILSYVSGGREYFLAVDRGILVKAGPNVTVSSRNAAYGPGLENLQETVERQFQRRTANEQRARSALDKLEAEFIRGLIRTKKR
jgi:F-type H+-transporting ATPase subunit epsilon